MFRLVATIGCPRYCTDNAIGNDVISEGVSEIQLQTNGFRRQMLVEKDSINGYLTSYADYRSFEWLEIKK